MRAVKVGPGSDPSTNMGPCINSARVELAQEHVDDAVALGATVECGGSPPGDEGLKNGFFFSPTLLRNATPDMRIFKEETFAPVIPLFRCVPALKDS
jgi:succinate-semialdehyde dehydrogenase / glutarate-semialdehyde dehydrogenase